MIKQYNEELLLNSDKLKKKEFNLKILQNLDILDEIFRDSKLTWSLIIQEKQFKRDLINWFSLLSNLWYFKDSKLSEISNKGDCVYFIPVTKILNYIVEQHEISISVLREWSLFYKLGALIENLFLPKTLKNQNGIWENTKADDINEIVLNEVIILTGNLISDNTGAKIEVLQTGIVNSIFYAIKVRNLAIK